MTSTSAAQQRGPLVPPADLRRDLLLALGGLVALVICGLIAHTGTVSAPERFVFRAVNELPGWLYPVMWPLQQLGNLVAGVVVAAVALILRRWRLAIAALIVTFVDLEPVIKSLVVRLRPGTTVPDAVLRGDVPVASQSFPSGHAVLIASLAVISTPYLRGRWRMVPWVLVAAVCVGRVYVGAHNPLDVIAGCGLGLIIGAFANIVVHLPIGRWWRSLRAARARQPGDASSRAPSGPGPGWPGVPLVALLVAGSLLAAAGCGGAGPRPSPSALGDDAITVGSFDFAESRLLAEIYSQALERDQFPVQRALSLGPREFVAPALSRGLLEVLPEYAGTALQFHSLGSAAPSVDSSATLVALTRALEGSSLRALAPAPAQDANAFVVTPEVAERFGLRTLSDVARVAPQLTLGGPPECPSRPTCLLGLRQVYGLEFKRFVPLDAGGPVSLQALLAGDVDVALLFTTDPAITQKGLVELVDDRHLQPAENITPLVRTEVVDSVGYEVGHRARRRVAAAHDRVPPAAERRRGRWDAARDGGRRLAGRAPTMTTEAQPLSAAGRSVPGGAARPQAVPSTVKQGHLRRRPSGAPPPLPRHLGRSGKEWLIALGLLLVWMIVIYTSAWARRVDGSRRCLRAASVRPRAHRLADRCGHRRRPCVVGVAGVLRRCRAPRAARRLQALATPVHVRRQRRGLRHRLRHPLLDPVAAPPVRRDHDRGLGRLLVAVVAGGRRLAARGGGDVLDDRAGSTSHDRQGGFRSFSSACWSSPVSTSPSTTPSTSSWRSPSRSVSW